MYTLGCYWLFPRVRKETIDPTLGPVTLPDESVWELPQYTATRWLKKASHLFAFTPRALQPFCRHMAATLFSSGSMRSRTLSYRQIIVKSELEKTKTHCCCARGVVCISLAARFLRVPGGCCFPARAMQNQLSWGGRGWFMARRVALSRERERCIYGPRADTFAAACCKAENVIAADFE
jgi:hypothetical protein